MRDFAKIDRLTESDFTGIFEAAGGSRFSDNDSKENIPNADYVINNVIVELKLVEEEGFDKTARQQKLSKLFGKYDKSPVVVIDPGLLSDVDQRKYFNILEGPIKTHVKKASKQLKSTSSKLGGKHTKILLIVNNGYSAMGIAEFKAVAGKCVRNDTTNIDYVITCGIYYYSDGFDSFVIAPFEIEGVLDDLEPCEYLSIRESWSAFLNKHMTEFVIEPGSRENSRLPILDLEFDVDGVTFVKPTPPFGKDSEFWVAGRPRINSSGIEECPPVGMIFPKLSRNSWGLVKEALEDSWKLQDSYEEWVKFSTEEENEYENIIQPFIRIEIEHDDLAEKVEDNYITSFFDLCNYASDIFSERVREIILSARNIKSTKIELDKYILLVIREIGRDKKNDLCSIYLATNVEEPEIIETFIENERIFFEHGVALASAYALKSNISMVLHFKDKTYAWT